MSEQFPQYKLLGKHMIVCVGPGGVGKTTFAAAAALRAAKLGKRVACLTIDPARRLGDVLGLRPAADEGKDDPSRIVTDSASPDALHNVTSLVQEMGGKGELHVGMLDAQSTFDSVVIRKSSSEARAEKILKNRLYRYVSGSLSGMQEYMALERLCQLQENESYDLIVLDTPPSDNVIDFFSAPSRMRNALDGPLVRMMRKVYGGSHNIGADILGRWALSVFNVLSRITGATLLDEMIEFVDALSDLFGNFSERAFQIEQMLQSEDVEVIMITRPDNASTQETVGLQHILEQSGFHVDGLVFNQCTYPEMQTEFPEQLCEPCRSELRQINQDWNRVFETEQKVVSEAMTNNAALGCICIIPLLPFIPNRLDMLSQVWTSLVPAIKIQS